MDNSPAAAEQQLAETTPSFRQRMLGAIVRLAAWASASRGRVAAASVLGLVALGGVFASWSYMAHLAVDPGNVATLEMALAALKEGRITEAKAIIGDMQDLPAGPELLGGAMYVLGAVKAHEAEKETSSVRRVALSEMASRYLLKARDQGIPHGYESQAAYLLGRSLASSGQSRESIAPLEEALRDPSQPSVRIHAILVNALLDAPNPNLDEALQHNAQVLADGAVTDEERAQAWLLHAETLLRCRRPGEAMEALAHVPVQGPLSAPRMLLSARVEIDAAEQLPEASSERDSKLFAAMSQLREAQRLEERGSDVTRQSLYWIAKCHELRGEFESALTEYGRLSKSFGDTPEGMTATLAEAEQLRLDGQVDRAMAGYRLLMQSVSDPEAYTNPLLPLAELHRRLMLAYQQFIQEEQFEQALALLELFEPVFGRLVCMELRAKTHRQWGDHRLAQAEFMDRWKMVKPSREGRFHLRAAGRAFEDLAQLRFASRDFTVDLWDAAECYFKGQSYTNAARVLEEYLHHEAEDRNAKALLRLGQSRLAASNSARAVEALHECMELFPDDAHAHQARLECARAYQQNGDLEEAERLLEINLASEALTPKSTEWKDSKFALGNLLYELGRYDESIAALQEAVDRYPEDEAALLARYTMARAYHNASEAPARRLRDAKTDTERQNNRKLLTDYLTLAHAAYQEVQRAITLRGHTENDPLDRTLLRNCYMMQGSALFELRRFEEARQAYGAVITRYQQDPIVLESFVQVANCWRRLEQPVKARLILDQAKMVLNRLPSDADFLSSTNFNREQWQVLLSQMSQW